MTSFLDCWSEVASTLFAEAVAGGAELVESLPRPFDAGSFGFEARLDGELQGRFSVSMDGAVLDAPLLGEGKDQKAGWGELLREIACAAAGELLARTGRHCRVVSFEGCENESQVSRAFQLRSAGRAWSVLVRDEVHAPAQKAAPQGPTPGDTDKPLPPSPLSPGVELLLDVELEATLRFGCREMPLGEILELGPGDVVQLDRNVSDPVDLVVGDKIVARGDVVLVNGNFGLRVTEVAVPRKRLESIRCLF